MKALNILKNLTEKDITFKKICKINKAIKELEDLQNENKSLVKTLEKYNEEMIDLRKENQTLKSVNQDLLNTIIEAQEAIENILERNK